MTESRMMVNLSREISCKIRISLMMVSWRVKRRVMGMRVRVNLERQRTKVTFHIQISVDSFFGDSTESMDVLDANDVGVLDGT